MNNNLLSYVNIIKASTARITGATTIHSKAVDMAGFEGCLFVLVGSTLLMGTSGSTAGVKKVQLYVKGSTASAGTFARYTGFAGSSSGLAAGVNDRVLMVDCYRPEKRYLKACVKGASSANSQIDCIMAIQYSGKRPGSSALQNSTTVVGSTVMVSPSTP